MNSFKTPALIASLLTLVVLAPGASALAGIDVDVNAAVDADAALAAADDAKAQAMGLVDQAKGTIGAKLEATGAAGAADINASASADTAMGLGERAKAAFETAVEGVKGFASGIAARISFDLSFG